MRHKFLCFVASAALLLAGTPVPLRAQAPAASSAADVAGAENFGPEQLDALLAPIALYPDVLLTQTLMATTNPIEIVTASRWLAQGNNKDLTVC